MRIEGEGSIHIEATPQQVWDVVSDVPRTGQWSPECFRADWLDGRDQVQGPAAGARFRGCNQLRWVGVWCSRCTVTVCEPGRELTWVVGDDPVDPNSRWTFSLRAADDGGCTLTQRWVMLREPLVVKAFFALAHRADAMRAGSATSLAQIKTLVEGAAGETEDGSPAAASTPHPWFARAWLRLAPLMDATGTAERRRELPATLSGAVCEVGAGSGANFVHYPASVRSVLAVEPDPTLRAAATATAVGLRATHPGLAIEVADGTAAAIGAPEASFDAVVACLVLCSVPDQHLALTEMRRVLRPQGALVVYEHVRSTRRLVGRVQDAVVPVWSRLLGGCHPNRDTLRAVADAGFTITGQREFAFPNSPVGLPHVLARAVRRG